MTGKSRRRAKSPVAGEAVAAVRLVGVSKIYSGEATALRDISLEIHDGEFFAVLGPSGSGKTTTLKLIGGFERPSSGEIWIGGTLMGDRPPFQRNVNTVFQQYALFPHLDVFGNVAFGLRMKGVPRRERGARVGEVLTLVQLEHLGRRKVSQLSGGEQQRVALARALVNEPAVLLLDEPLGSLDLKLRKEMQRELKALQERVGISFVHVTHDQEEAITMADRVAVLHRGELMQVGTPSEIYEHPVNRFVATFVGEVNLLNGVVSSIENGLVALDVDGLGQLLATEAGPRSTLVSGNAAAIAFRPERAEVVPAGEAALARAEDENVMRGALSRTIYRGPQTRYEVRLTNGQTVVVDVPVGGKRSRPMVEGDAVDLRWPIESAKVLAG